MAKKYDVPITEIEINEYLDTMSDFSFELKCLQKLISLGFECLHGGSYSDPITGKNRQYDLRIKKNIGKCNVYCAVECKSLVETFPLLTMCIPRQTEESYHSILFSSPKDFLYSDCLIPAMQAKNKLVKYGPDYSGYKQNDFVAKSIIQVGKSDKNGLGSGDGEVYDKWTQALSSIEDLITEAGDLGESTGGISQNILLPILVVPDNMLWKVNYDIDGNKVSEPQKVNRSSLYIGQEYFIKTIPQTKFNISHLEFVTFSGIEELLKEIEPDNLSWFAESAHLFELLGCPALNVNNRIET